MPDQFFQSKIERVERLFEGSSSINSDLSKMIGKPVRIKQVRQYWEALVDDINNGLALANKFIYVHTPFCPSRCVYCRADSVALKNRNMLKTNLNALHNEVSILAPAVESVAFDGVYFGGGTPSIYDDDDFERMLGIIIDSFTFAPDSERSIEMTPNTASEKKLRAAFKFGINRISYGVQSATRKVLRLADRDHQTMSHVKQAVRIAKDAGIPLVNTDLIGALPGETREDFIASVKQLCACGPDTIELNRYTVCAKSDPSYRSDHPDGFDLWDNISDLFFEIAQQSGYTRSSLRHNNAIVTKDGFRFDSDKHYEQNSTLPGATLGLGALSLSSVFGKADYFNWGPDRPEASPAEDWYLCIEKNIEFEARASVMQFIKYNNTLVRRDFKNLFNHDPVSYFKDEFEFMARRGFVAIDSESVSWKFPDYEHALRTAGIFVPDTILDMLESRSIDPGYSFTADFGFRVLDTRKQNEPISSEGGFHLYYINPPFGKSLLENDSLVNSVRAHFQTIIRKHPELSADMLTGEIEAFVKTRLLD